MKIVMIEDFFHPDAGYQINILSKYLAEFGHNVSIITSEMEKIPSSLTVFFGKEDIVNKDKKYMEQTRVCIIRLPIHRFMSGRSLFYIEELKKNVINLKPDIIYAHGNDTFSAMSFIIQINRLPCAFITDSHMLEMASENKFKIFFDIFYRCFITPKLKKNNIPVIRTQNDSYVQKFLGIPLLQAPWISYGTDTQLFHPDNAIKKMFRKNNVIDESSFVIIYTGKLDESKGGLFLANAFKKKFKSNKKIILVCVGNTTGYYGEKVEEVFSKSENKIIRFPTQKYIDLAQFYQSSDLSIFAKQCSLSFYDAQGCGLPVLSEDNKINIDRCSHNNGWNFKSGDIDDFRLKIEYIASLNDSLLKKISENAYNYIINNYKYETKAREYESIILQTYEKWLVSHS